MRVLFEKCKHAMISLICIFSAGQQLAKQAIQEIVILPSLRPEVGKRKV